MLRAALVVGVAPRRDSMRRASLRHAMHMRHAMHRDHSHAHLSPAHLSPLQVPHSHLLPQLLSEGSGLKPIFDAPSVREWTVLVPQLQP